MEGRMTQPSSGILPRPAPQREKSKLRCAILDMLLPGLVGVLRRALECCLAKNAKTRFCAARPRKNESCAEQTSIILTSRASAQGRFRKVAHAAGRGREAHGRS